MTWFEICLLNTQILIFFALFGLYVDVADIRAVIRYGAEKKARKASRRSGVGDV